MVSTSLYCAIAVSLGLLARSATAQESKTWTNPNHNGGNMYLWGQSQHLSWGDQNPADIVESIRKNCSEQACDAGPFTFDTKVVTDGKISQYTLTVETTESTFPRTGPGNPSQMITSLKDLLSKEPWVTSSKQHWDQDSEGISCPSAASNYCWIPNKAEGDSVQYVGPVSVDARFEGEKQALISHLRLVFKVEAKKDDSEIDCQKIVDTAQEIASLVEGIPETGFQVGTIICDILSHST